MIFDFDPNDHRCRYLRINGARCRQAALDGEHLCFEHKLRKLRTRPGRKPTCLPSSTFNEVPLVSFCWVEDHASILSNLNHVIEAFAHGTIDHRQAVAYGCLMRTCLKTLKQMHELEDLAVELKEKPAQRFELDECENPLALDEPKPTVPSETCAPPPHACTLQPETCDLAADPGTPQPEPCTPTGPGTPQPAKSNPSPFLDLDCGTWEAGRRIRERWADSVRDYYNNDPTMLATLGIQPRPEPGQAAPSTSGPQSVASDLQPETCGPTDTCSPQCEPSTPTETCTPQPEPADAPPEPFTDQPEPCTDQPETCTLELTAAADLRPATGHRLPASLSPDPYPLSPSPAHTCTSGEIFCEAQ